MAVMHTPDTTGLVAVYGSANGYPNFERDVLGWDKLGRPLVMCGDALHVAQTAPFEKYPKFGWLKKPDMVSAFQQEIYNHLQNTPDITEAVAEAVSEAVRAELKSRRPQKPLPEVGVGILEEHMGVPLLIHIREANPRMSSYGNSVTGTPLVDYLAWNPFSDETSRHDDVMIAQPRVAAELGAGLACLLCRGETRHVLRRIGDAAQRRAARAIGASLDSGHEIPSLSRSRCCCAVSGDS